MTDRRRDKTPCTVDGCTKPQNTRGMCAMHYWRVRKYGTTGPPPGRVYPPKKACAVEGCDLAVMAHGWCNMHSQRWYRHGDPLAKLNLQGEGAEARFWAKVDKTDTCWLWTAYRDGDGYGHFKNANVDTMAHRFAYEMLVGPIPTGLGLDHLCHTNDLSCPGGPACPHRRCVRPDHLEPVTNVENLRRGRTGVVNAAKTHCPQGHPYDEANTRYERTPSGFGRKCRTCMRERDRKRRR